MKCEHVCFLFFSWVYNYIFFFDSHIETRAVKVLDILLHLLILLSNLRLYGLIPTVIQQVFLKKKKDLILSCLIMVTTIA